MFMEGVKKSDKYKEVIFLIIYISTDYMLSTNIPDHVGSVHLYFKATV